MSRALLFLWWRLLQRRALRAALNLRRPTSLIGFVAVAFFLGVLYHHRHAEIFTHCFRTESLLGAALLLIGGAIFKGFLQRGLVFEAPDIQFLFTSPFTQRQLIFYRLLPGYGYALVQSVAFWVLFSTHFRHPLLAAICLALLQITSFHVATGAAIFSGNLSEESYYRARWILLGIYLLVTALYLRLAWDFKLVPSFIGGPLSHWLFYPAVSFADLGVSPMMGQWTLRLIERETIEVSDTWQVWFYLALFSAGAWLTLRLLLRSKTDILEPALATSSRVAEKRWRRREEGTIQTLSTRRAVSLPLPRQGVFGGAGALVWKNLVVAMRSRRELALAMGFTLIYTGFLVLLRWAMHQLLVQGGSLPARQLRDFDLSLVGLLAFLAFFLQRTFPFDFRRDGQHLVAFRALPLSPWALVLAELAVPTLLCLAFQMLGLVLLLVFASFQWTVVVALLLGFPAVALALNGVWNLHYLLAAARRAGGRAESASPVAMVMVVLLSFLVFYPAGWLALKVGRSTFGPTSEPLAFGAWLVTQYLVDFLLVLLLGKLFQRFEVGRESG